MSNVALAEELLPEHAPVELSIVGPSAIQLMLDLEQAGLVTPRSLTLPDDIEYDRAEALGVFITEVITRGRFYQGDLLIEAEQKMPDSFSQLAEALGLSEPARLFLMSVCAAVPAKRRREELLWGHHVAVHRLGAREQKRWLAAAVKGNWTVDELRRQMKAHRTDERPQLPGTEPGEPDLALLLKAAQSLVKNAEDAGENIIVRREDYTQVLAALGQET